MGGWVRTPSKHHSRLEHEEHSREGGEEGKRSENGRGSRKLQRAALFMSQLQDWPPNEDHTEPWQPRPACDPRSLPFRPLYEVPLWSASDTARPTPGLHSRARVDPWRSCQGWRPRSRVGARCSHVVSKSTGDPAVAGSGGERGSAEDGLFWGDFQLTLPDTSSEEEAAKLRRVPAPGAASGSSILSSDIC